MQAIAGRKIWPRSKLLLVGFFAVLLAACSSGKRISAENDRLRQKVLDLEKQTALLSGENAELKARLAEADTGNPVAQEVRDATPRVSSISIDRLSHAGDTNGDGRPDVLTVYVSPADGRGRFTQLVGTLSAHAACLPEQSDAITIGRLSLGPAEVREAYRSAFTGTHYTLEVPLSLDAAPEADQCTVRVVYRDGYTGEELVAERAVKLKSAT